MSIMRFTSGRTFFIPISLFSSATVCSLADKQSRSSCSRSFSGASASKSSTSEIVVSLSSFRPEGTAALKTSPSVHW